MRILHVVQSLDPAQGGLPMAAVGLATAQAEMGDEVGILHLCDPKGLTQLEQQYGHHARWNAVSVERLGDWSGAARWFTHPGKAMDGFCPQWVIIHGVWDPILVRAGAWCRRQRVPYSVVPHSMLHPWHQRRHALAKAILQPFGWRALLRHAEFIHALNQTEAGYVTNLLPGQRVEIIPNGVAIPNDFSPPDTPPPYALFLNRLGPQKGVDVLVEALRTSPDAPRHPWIFAGPDYGMTSPLRELAQTHDRITLRPACYGAEKWALMAGATCYMLPSRSEGFSMAVLEALACGVPVVLTPECHFPEAAAAGAALECPLDGARWLREVDQLMDDPERLAAMGSAGRELVRSTYTWPVIAQKYRSLLKD